MRGVPNSPYPEHVGNASYNPLRACYTGEAGLSSA